MKTPAELPPLCPRPALAAEARAHLPERGLLLRTQDALMREQDHAQCVIQDERDMLWWNAVNKNQKDPWNTLSRLTRDVDLLQTWLQGEEISLRGTTLYSAAPDESPCSVTVSLTLPSTLSEDTVRRMLEDELGSELSAPPLARDVTFELEDLDPGATLLELPVGGVSLYSADGTGVTRALLARSMGHDVQVRRWTDAGPLHGH